MSTSAADRAGRLRLHARLKAAAWSLVARLATPKRPLTVAVGNGQSRVTVTVAPAGATAAGVSGAGSGCLPFSPLEAAVMLAVGPTGTLLGKQVASRVSQEYGGKLKVILGNLVERQALEHAEGGQGYRWTAAYRKAQAGAA
jgi:hypothetical protein